MDELLELLKGKFKLGKLEFTSGGLRISALYDAAGIDAELAVTLDASGLIEVLKRVIPGTVDDFILDLLKAAIAVKK